MGAWPAVSPFSTLHGLSASIAPAAIGTNAEWGIAVGCWLTVAVALLIATPRRRPPWLQSTLSRRRRRLAAWSDALAHYTAAPFRELRRRQHGRRGFIVSDREENVRRFKLPGPPVRRRVRRRGLDSPADAPAAENVRTDLQLRADPEAETEQEESIRLRLARELERAGRQRYSVSLAAVRLPRRHDAVARGHDDLRQRAAALVRATLGAVDNVEIVVDEEHDALVLMLPGVVPRRVVPVVSELAELGSGTDRDGRTPATAVVSFPRDATSADALLARCFRTLRPPRRSRRRRTR